MQITAVQLSRKKAVQAAKTTGRYWKPWHLTWNIVSLVVLAIILKTNWLYHRKPLIIRRIIGF